MKGSERFCILMTATVAPKGTAGTATYRSDPQVRLADYREGLRFWLQLKDDRIGGVVFVENSGYPLDALRAEADSCRAGSRRCEFISCDFPPPPEGLHYGYSEFALVDHALKESQLLRDFPYFIKATGRYKWPAVSKLIDRLPSNFLVAADCRIQKPLSKAPNPILPVALVLFQTDFFRRELSGLYQTMVPAPPWTRKQFIEDVFYDHLFPRRNEPGMALRWPCNCDPVGVGAGHGDNYTSFSKRLKSLAREGLRRFFPSLWW